jgi:hypothetical protein
MTQSTLQPPPNASLPPEFEALSDLVERARKGEIVLDVPMHGQGSRLPAGWYDTPPPARVAPSLPAEWRAAVWGLACGLVVLIPGLLVLREVPVAPAPPPSPVRATALAGASEVPMVTTPVLITPAPDVVGDIEAAERLLAEGNIAAARAVLVTAAAAEHPRALFALAETYDPNLLAARGERGVVADAVQARALYAAAASLGHPLATARLRALQ